MAATLTITLEDPQGGGGPNPPPNPNPPPPNPNPNPNPNPPPPNPNPNPNPPPPNPNPNPNPQPNPPPPPNPNPPPPPPEPLGNVSAFDRPVAVVVMGPKPLPVTIVGDAPGKGGGPAQPMPKPEEGWAKWLLDQLGTGVRRTGIAAAGAAGGSVMPALATAADGAVAGLSKLGPYGMAAAAGVKVFSEAVTAVKETIDALVKRGRELAPYSGTLAGASARADVRKLLADIGEADRVGPALARLIDAQSRAEAMQQRLLEPIKTFLAETLTVLLERGIETLIGILEAVNALPGIRGDFTKLINDLKGIAADSGDTTALVERWARGFGGALPGPTAPAPRGGGRAVPLGVPLI